MSCTLVIMTLAPSPKNHYVLLQSPSWREELQGMAAAAADAAAALKVVTLRPEDSRYLREEREAEATETAAAAAEAGGGATAAAEPAAPAAAAAPARDHSAAVAALGKLLASPPQALLCLWYLAERDPGLAEEESMAAVVGLSPGAAEALQPGCGAWAAAELQPGEERGAEGEARDSGREQEQPAAELQAVGHQP